MSSARPTVYDSIDIPALRASVIRGSIRGTIVGLVVGCLALWGIGDDFGTQMWPLVCAFLLVFFACAGFILGQYIMSRQRLIETQLRHTRHQREYWQTLDALAAQAPSERSTYVDRWRSLYTPKKGERMLWGGASQIGALPLGDVSTDILWPDALAHLELERLCVQKASPEGPQGVLVLSSVGATFATQDRRVLWHLPWEDIERCEPTLNALVLHPYDQPPRACILLHAGYDPTCSPLLVDVLISERLHDASPNENRVLIER